MPWGKLSENTRKAFSLSLVSSMKKEKEIFHNFMSSVLSSDKKIEKFKSSNNLQNEVVSSGRRENEILRDNETLDYGKNDDERLFHFRNRFIRHSRESLSALCKLGVTYDTMPVQLASEIISVSTDLMEMYVRSVTEKHSESYQNKNGNKDNNEYGNVDNNENNNGKKDAGYTVKSIPPATMAAASLHWLALMKIPFTAFSTMDKNTVLRYLETVLTYSTETGKSGISFPFLIGVLTNLETVGVRWENYVVGVK